VVLYCALGRRRGKQLKRHGSTILLNEIWQAPSYAPPRPKRRQHQRRWHRRSPTAASLLYLAAAGNRTPRTAGRGRGWESIGPCCPCRPRPPRAGAFPPPSLQGRSHHQGRALPPERPRSQAPRSQSPGPQAPGPMASPQPASPQAPKPVVVKGRSAAALSGRYQAAPSPSALRRPAPGAKAPGGDRAAARPTEVPRQIIEG